MEQSNHGYFPQLVSLLTHLLKVYYKEQGWTNSRHLVAQATKLFMVAPNSFSVIMAVLFLTYKNVCQFTCTEQRAPGKSKVHRSIQKYGSVQGPCFMLSFSYLVYGVGFWICEKFVNPGKDDLSLGAWGSQSLVCGQAYYGSDMPVTVKHSFSFLILPIFILFWNIGVLYFQHFCITAIPECE
jgi:hypothetical protein